MLRVIFILLVFLSYAKNVLGQGHFAYDPKVLQKRVDLIKAEISNKRSQDLELIQWGDKIRELNNRKMASGRGDLQDVPNSVQEASDRENDRSNDCHNNNPFDKLYTQTSILCNFEEVKRVCVEKYETAKKKADAAENELQTLLKNSDPRTRTKSLWKMKKTLGRNINMLFDASDDCSAQIKPIVDSCVELYDVTFSPEVASFYVNSCTEESLDKQVHEFFKYMNSEDAPTYAVNAVVQNHIKLRSEIADMAAILLQIDKHIKDLEKIKKGSQPIGKVPTS